MAHVTEVHAYVHILRELTEKKGWKKDQVYTQNEIRSLKPIVDQLGDTTPENIVKINEKQFYVIEAKSKRSLLQQALKEAREDYANIINKSKLVQAVFITGIAGNEHEGYVSTNQFLHKGKWESIKENDIETTGLLSKSQVERILESNNPSLKDVEISEEEFLKVAEEINGILHENSIHKDYRARFISALLLAILEGTEINLNESPTILTQSINTRVNVVLKAHKKPEFSRFISLDLPSSEDNHTKFKTAIVYTIQALLGLNIRSAMRSGKDVLGQFYEVFLKYGNGAKEIGIVLTPRHITRFVAHVLDIQTTDLVLDPTCGTGGFLVAAFDEAKKKAKSDNDFEKFRLWGLYGIEDKDPVVALALVNMIFRGDGKNNIIEGNCFAKWLNSTNINGEMVAEYLQSDKEGRVPPITKVLMNPPFAQKNSKEMEYQFVRHALKQMQNDALLFSILPVSAMIEQGEEKEWRKNQLLKENTLLAVITFPPELFYPIGVHSLGIIVKKGIPHDSRQKVFWLRAINDGFVKKKKKRLRSAKERDTISEYTEELKKFIQTGKTNLKEKAEEFCLSELDQNDKLVELVPETYLKSEIPKKESIEKSIDELVRETASYLIRYKKDKW